MTLTLYFQSQIFNSHVLGMGWSVDLEWKRCELDTMLDAQWASSWPTVPGKEISFQPVGPWMGYSFTDLGAEGCCRSLNALLLSIVVFVLFPCRNLQDAICSYYDYEQPNVQVPRMAFLKDETVGEGESVPPSTRFTKTWRIQNIGEHLVSLEFQSEVLNIAEQVQHVQYFQRIGAEPLLEYCQFVS